VGGDYVNKDGLSEYEQRALIEIDQYKAKFAATPARRLVPGTARDALRNRGGQAAKRLQSAPGFEVAASAARGGYMRAAEGLGGMTSKVAHYTLSEDRIVASFQRRNIDVNALTDIRTLDLKIVEKRAKPKYMDLAYASTAAAEGALAGALISGGELLASAGTVASGGATAAPSLGLITTVVAGDAAAVLSICSRVVAHTAMYYGYDPTEPAEAVFAMSVMNLGSAVTQSGKYAAYVELSLVTQALARNATWSALNKHLLPQIAQRFARAFGVRLTKTKLGQFVPVAGIAAGMGLNYWIVQQVSTAAYWTYRERFLNDKLNITSLTLPAKPDGVDEPDEGVIDLLSIVEDAIEGREAGDADTPSAAKPSDIDETDRDEGRGSTPSSG
jgi:hypothetical protein